MDERISSLQAVPRYEQKTNEWLEERRKYLTASEVAIINDYNERGFFKNAHSLIKSKCMPASNISGVAMDHGNKYEEIATMIYVHRNNVKVHDFGLIPHQGGVGGIGKIRIIGASPDGITGPPLNNTKKSVGKGIMLEIKCPYGKREINENILPYYAYGWEEEYLSHNKIDRIIYMVSRIRNCHQDSYDRLNNDNKKRILFIRHQGLIAETDKNLQAISNFIGESPSVDTPSVLLQQNCPRSPSAATPFSTSNKSFKEKLKEIKELSSPEAYRILVDMDKQFESKQLAI